MKEIHTFEAHASYVLGLRFTPDSRTLVSSGMDNVVKLWSVPGWEHWKTLEGHANSVNSFDLSPDGNYLVTGSSDNYVKIWAFPDGEVLHSLQDRKKVVSSVQFAADGMSVTAGSYGGRTAGWSIKGEPLYAFKANDGNLSSAALSPDLHTLVTSGLGDDIRLWDLPSCEHRRDLSGHKTAVTNLKFIRNGSLMVSVGYEGSIRFWDTEKWETTRILEGGLDGLRAIAFSPDEKTMAVSIESKVLLYGVNDLSPLAELPVSTKVVNGIAYSPDNKWLALGAADKKIRIWDLG